MGLNRDKPKRGSVACVSCASSGGGDCSPFWRGFRRSHDVRIAAAESPVFVNIGEKHAFGRTTLAARLHFPPQIQIAASRHPMLCVRRRGINKPRINKRRHCRNRSRRAAARRRAGKDQYLRPRLHRRIDRRTRIRIDKAPLAQRLSARRRRALKIFYVVVVARQRRIKARQIRGERAVSGKRRRIRIDIITRRASSHSRNILHQRDDKRLARLPVAGAVGI